MRVLVTRPEPQASDWASRLSSRGIQAQALPLIAILPAADAAAVTLAWQRLDAVDGVMFVSPAAVRAWLDARPSSSPPWPSRVWVAAPGPGTARSLAALGAAEILVPPDDAEQFDSDTLWSTIGARDWRGQRILVVHGGAGREALPQRWREAGASVDKLQAYRRGDASWSAAHQAVFDAAIADPANHAWLFGSGEAVERLAARAGRDVARADHRAICTHPAIAARARAAGFGTVLGCRPEIDEVVQVLRAEALRQA